MYNKYNTDYLICPDCGRGANDYPLIAEFRVPNIPQDGPMLMMDIKDFITIRLRQCTKCKAVFQQDPI